MVLVTYSVVCIIVRVNSAGILMLHTRAGRFLGIIVIPRYCNETISVSRRFRRNDNITISILLRFLVFVTAY